jgi:hypothetical protein
VAFIPFENPFCAPGRWWKGNLHTHTTVSDGALSPAAAAAAYRGLGYDFLAITDHLRICRPFEPPPGLLVVYGAEYHTFAGDPVRAWHLLCLGLKGPVLGPEAWSQNHMPPLPELLASIRENASFFSVAHPYWSNLVEDDLLAVEGAQACEVYNGVCHGMVDRGYSEQAWDYALACGKRLGALAVDDAHRPSDVGRGWIMLRAEKLTLDVLLDALSKGLYYSTTGPEIFDLRVDGPFSHSSKGNVVSVRCSPARSIKFMARSADGKYFGAHEGQLLESAEYELRGTETYLRVQVEDTAGRRAYTNPLYLESTGRT